MGKRFQPGYVCRQQGPEGYVQTVTPAPQKNRLTPRRLSAGKERRIAPTEFLRTTGTFDKQASQSQQGFARRLAW
jgi:hypothetical protein